MLRSYSTLYFAAFMSLYVEVPLFPDAYQSEADLHF